MAITHTQRAKKAAETGIDYLQTLEKPGCTGKFSDDALGNINNLTLRMFELERAFFRAHIDTERQFAYPDGTGRNSQSVSLKELISEQQKMGAEAQKLLGSERKRVSPNILDDLQRHAENIHEFLHKLDFDNIVQYSEKENGLRRPARAVREAAKEVKFTAKALREIAKGYEAGRARGTSLT